MANVDLAKLKRLREAVSSTLDKISEDSVHGLPQTYNNLRDQAAEAVPEGLRQELEAIAPKVGSAPQPDSGDVIQAAMDGAVAYAHLAALKGWLDAIIRPKEPDGLN